MISIGISIIHLVLGFQRSIRPTADVAYRGAAAADIVRCMVIVYTAYGASAIVLRFVVKPSAGGGMRFI